MGQPVYRLGWSVPVVFDFEGPWQRDLQLLMERLTVGLEVWMRDHLVYWLLYRVNRRFVNEGDDASGPWQPLSPATEAIRASQGYSPAHPINVRSGELRNFLLGNRGDVTGLGGGFQLTYPGNTGSGLDQEKLQTAQRGKPQPNTPERPVLALGVEDYNQIHEDLADYLTQGLI
jgi:hypothetical protein